MNIKHIKKYMAGLGISLFFLQGMVMTACSDWTEPEANDYFVPQSEGYKKNLKDYFNSPHKVMFGWFGNWSAGSMSNSLCGLPDSIDFVSLWLCWGNLSEAQQTDLKKFQEKGSRAVLCWRAGDIGANLTPEGVDPHDFWGYSDDDEQSMIQAAQKYAQAIADTCSKYNVDGFDYDIEDWGTLMNWDYPSVPNAFMRKLRSEFDKEGRMLVADIPGGKGWLWFYYMLENDVLESLDYLVWQTYDLGPSGLDDFFDGAEGVREWNPEMFETVVKKSIVTATFEEAAKKYRFVDQQSYQPSFGIPHAGMGAYHIEYDYSGTPDYPTVRAAIAAQNPPVNN
ncbi:MAG: glycoside hydrolase family 18 [Bacteroides sp.]